jgi:hypothetical protein
LFILFEMVEQGFAIGNGLTDPAIQYKAYADYALDMGVIKQADYDRINKVMVPACELAIKLCGNLHVMLFLYPFNQCNVSSHICMLETKVLIEMNKLMHWSISFFL